MTEEERLSIVDEITAEAQEGAQLQKARSEGLQQETDEQAAQDAETESKIERDDEGNIVRAKSTQETMDPSEFGLKENVQDLGLALQGGLMDAWNNTVSIGKFFDPKFYQQNNPKEDPYKFLGGWGQFNTEEQPMTRTAWGKFIRGATDITVGFVGLGKLGWGLKGISAAMRGVKVAKGANKASLAMRLAKDGTKGAIVDAWDNDSQTANLSQTLIDIKPEWFSNPITQAVATNEDMSPAQRTALNMLEGFGLGSLFGLAMESGGAASRALSKSRADEIATAKKTAAEKLPDKPQIPDKINEALTEYSDQAYKDKTIKLTNSTAVQYEANQFKSLKRNGIIDENITIDEWRASWKTPDSKQLEEMTLAKYGEVTPENVAKMGEIVRPKWSELEPFDQNLFMQKRGSELDMDWGPQRDFSRFNIKQSKQAMEIAEDQFAEDVVFGSPRVNPYYANGANAFENQPLSGTGNILKGITDQINIRNNIEQKRGSNRSPVPEAAIRRMATGSGNPFEEIDDYAKKLISNEEYRKAYEGLYGGTSKQELARDFVDAASDVKQFLDISGNARVSDSSEQALLEFIENLARGKETKIEGISALNHRQLTVLDTVIGQLTGEIRDMSKGSMSISDVIDTRVAGGMGDGIMNRYKALQALRARTSALSSYNLRRFKSPESGKVDIEAIAAEAEREARERADLLREVIQKDSKGGELFEAFQYYSAVSNGSPMTMRDMDAFYSKRMKGFSNKTEYQKNVVLEEMATMGVHSMLSGPKTFARAGVGGGINTVMKPVSVIVGANLAGDPRTARAAAAELGGMFDALGDAWRKGIEEWNTYLTKDDLTVRGVKFRRGEAEFDAMRNYYKVNGTDGEKAYMNLANMMHGLNNLPFLNYGTRIMASMDAFFGQLIARGRGRSKAFLEVYDATIGQQKNVSSDDLKTLVRGAEEKFNKDIWTADGELSDAYANFQWNEAALKGELGPRMQKLQQVLEQQPFIKPFVGLFMKTGINALELTGKYTPILNRTLKESRDILTKSVGDPDLLQYGIKTQDELLAARASLRGREAIGMATIASAGMLYLNGNLTGNGPPDRRLRNAWMQTGEWQPRSIRLGDMWVSYESLEPFSGILAFIADVGDSQQEMGEEWAGEHLAKLTHLISANVTNKTFLAGLFNLQDIITSKGQRASSVAANIANNQIPLSSLRNELGKLVSPGMRELETGFFQGIRNRNLYTDLVVGADGKLPYRYDILNGQPLRDWDPLTRSVNAILPFNINYHTNPTRELLLRSGLDLAQTFNSGPNGESLEGYPDLKSRYQFLMGQQNIEGALEKLFQKPEIMQSIMDMENNTSKGIKYSPSEMMHIGQITRIFDRAKKVAWRELVTEDSRAKMLGDKQALDALESRYRKRGENDKANEINAIKEFDPSN